MRHQRPWSTVCRRWRRRMLLPFDGVLLLNIGVSTMVGEWSRSGLRIAPPGPKRFHAAINRATCVIYLHAKRESERLQPEGVIPADIVVTSLESERASRAGTTGFVAEAAGKSNPRCGTTAREPKSTELDRAF